MSDHGGNGGEFLSGARDTAKEVGVELLTLEGDATDLASLVAILERAEKVKDDAKQHRHLATYQLCFAIEECLTGVLCERLSDPGQVLTAVAEACQAYARCMEADAQDPSQLEHQEMNTKIAALFEILEVPVVELPGGESIPDRIFDSSDESETAEPAGQDTDSTPETPTPAVAPPEPQPAQTASVDLTDEEVASTGLPAAFDDPDLYKEFAFETSEHFGTVEENLLELESNPEDTELINAIFRPIHSVKGGAGFLSLTGMNRLAHDTETLLDRCRKGELPVTDGITDLCLRSLDALKQMIANLMAALDSTDPVNYPCEPVIFGPIRQTIQAILNGEIAPEEAGDGATKEPAAAVDPATAFPLSDEEESAAAGTAQPIITEKPQSATVPAEVTAEVQAKVKERNELVNQEAEIDMEDETQASRGLPKEFEDDDDIGLFERFVVQCNEHIESIEQRVLELEQTPDDQELINSLFRAFHSMKGDAGFLYLAGINCLSHDTETLLDKLRKHEIRATNRPIEYCLRSADLLKQMVQNLDTVLKAKDPHAALKDENIKPVIIGPLREEIQTFIEDPDKMPKLGEILLAQGAISSDQLETALDLQGAPLGEVLVRSGAADAKTVEKALEQQKSAAGGGGGGAAGGGGSVAQAIKVDTQKIDRLVNLVGELVIIEAQVTQMATQVNLNGNNETLEKNLSHLGKITKELQDRSMALRMMPIKQTFQKMTRLIRDSSRKMNKKVKLVLKGEETELDKTVVEQIGDPLVHMLRNSVDHGIESEEERKAAGKSETGTIWLEAYYQGDRIVIRVRDDGKGLDRERIKEKALENGLIAPGAEMQDSDVYKMIFEPGFSTAKEVTDISGRGVGMDVVRRNIDRLRGRIDVDSEPGKGTVVTISLPLTLAIIDGMVVRVGDEEFIIPTGAIQESVQPKTEELSTVTERGEMLHVRGSLLPLLRLYDLWDIRPKHTDPCQALVVIVENNDRRACVMVDELVGQQQIVIKHLGTHFGDIQGIAGATILGSGNVGLILDVDGLLKRALQI